MYRFLFPRTLIFALMAALTLAACSGQPPYPAEQTPSAAVDDAAPADLALTTSDARPQFLNAYADW